ncbi:F-box/FBD/LRR-repeat protein At1g13570-like [Bidens hawaiensis]|uniref:F-box/FBD/LRR-repeat protein At1g13570-like n=1 Tax=Bidens hawaiensis TaxID=980011 RepID=UPI0040497E6A
MNTQCPSVDIISTLPHHIIETILSCMPIQDALRTSILSKTWQHCWRNMPKLVFTDDMVKLPSDSDSKRLKKDTLVSAIIHVLFLHKGPIIIEFNCSIGYLHMDFEFAQIISYLARENKVKDLIFINDYNILYKLPVSIFSLEGLELIDLQNCTFELPLTFNGFRRLDSVSFWNVEVSAQMLKRFLSKCPLLVYVELTGRPESDFAAGGNKLTFVDLLHCVPLIESLDISNYYMKYLCVDGMPRMLPTSLVHLSELYLEVCLMEQNEISSALCVIRSSPVLVKIYFMMCDKKSHVRQTPTNFLDLENHPDLKLDHLETLVIDVFSNLPLEMEFVKLIMAKSPVLKKVQIYLRCTVSVDEELKILRDMLRLLPFPRTSLSAKLTVERPEPSDSDD